ncbi:MAG: hypothetical protein M5U19_03210 [Microthrixaceae bacterium]|nr:hypothetical protein [Microthrixaceae bacterium]
MACRDEILELAASIHAAEAELVAKLAEFDAGEGWVGSGVRSLGHWLTLTCGFTVTEARMRADLATRRAELPLLFEAFGSGAFSVGALRCAEKVATPANDAEVTRVALVATAPQASRSYAAFRKAVCAERRHDEHLARRDREGRGGQGDDGPDGGCGQDGEGHRCPCHGSGSRPEPTTWRLPTRVHRTPGCAPGGTSTGTCASTGVSTPPMARL